MANKDNPRKGALFEKAVGKFLSSQGIKVVKNFSVELGADSFKRPRKFDFGSDVPKIVVECKSHAWTKSNNAPSAKMAVWNEAMYYFSLVPKGYRKMLFVLRSTSGKSGETLLEYYFRRYGHLVPKGVEIWEFNQRTRTAKCFRDHQMTTSVKLRQ